MIDLTIVDRAFSRMAERAIEELGGGVFTEKDYLCCQTCGFAELDSRIEAWNASAPKYPIVGCVFYHNQDTASCEAGYGLYLCYAADEKAPITTIQVGELLVDCLRAEGLTVEWDGSEKTRIYVKDEAA